MKNKVILILLLIIIIGTFGSLTCLYIIDHNRMDNNEPVLFSTWGKSYTPPIEDIVEEESPIIEEPSVPEYLDENPVKLGIYVQEGYQKKLITDYTCSWAPENVFDVFYAVPTQEETISNSDFDTLWKDYINQYPNPENYRIGYNLKFTLASGEVVDSQILNPDDAYYMFPKVMVFLYDDVNLVPGQRYYHITQDVMYDYTICSSIKLVGDVDSKNIVSDIELTAFCFDSDDDFDPETGKYRGNSSYTITIKQI